MVDIAQLGIQVNSAPAVKAADDLDDLAASAARAEKATDNLAVASNRSGAAVRSVGTSSFAAAGGARMLGLQLSQVVQQASATGQVAQALAVQAADIGAMFGGVGVAAGILATVALPTLIAAFSGTSEEAAAAAAAIERVKDAQEALAGAIRDTQTDIDKLRFGVDESYQVELLREQVRLQGEIAAKVAEHQRVAASLADDQRAQSAYIADANAEIATLVEKYNDISARLGDQQNRSAQLAILEGIRAQRAGEAAARQKEATDALARAQSFYGSIAEKAATVSVKTSDAATAAATLAGVSFGNISLAASWAGALAANLRAAAAVNTNMMTQGQTTGSTSWYFGQTAKDLLPPVAGLAPMPSVGGGGGGGGSDDFAQRLQTLMDELQTERETVDAWYAENQAILADRRALEILGEQAHKDAMLAIEEEYQSRLAQIQSDEQSVRLGYMAAFFGSMADVFQAGGSRLAKIAAAAAAIEGTINAYRAALQTLADPTVPFWGKAAAYASILAAGMKGVAAIRQAGGVGGGGGSTGAVTAAQGSTGGGQVIDVSIYGLGRDRTYTGDDIAQIFNGLEEESRRRGFQGFRFAFV